MGFVGGQLRKKEAWRSGFSAAVSSFFAYVGDGYMKCVYNRKC